MNDPSQYLVHITSRGPEVAGVDGFVGDFKVFMKQPIKDVNKFGLMQYSIPKMLDIVNEDNNLFYLRFGYLNGDEVLAPVRLPQMDYYSCLISQQSDITTKAGAANESSFRDKKRCSFDEILQTSINWALVKHGTNLNPFGAGDKRVCDTQFIRMGCVVNFDQATGLYKFTFGYRGSKKIADAGKPSQHYTGPVLGNSGAPCACEEDGDNIAESLTGDYSYVDCNGVVAKDVAGGDDGNNDFTKFQLSSVTFEAVPMRLQLLLGLGSSDEFYSKQLPVNTIVERGRMVVVNYNGDPGGATGLVECEMSLQPNLDPPSVLYLQLSVPGTRSKILGQSAERGGWAIPTDSSAYVSKYMNLPNMEKYHPLMVRQMPALTADNFNIIWAPGSGEGENDAGLAGSGYNFDPYPLGNKYDGIDQVDNFSLTGGNKSRMIIFGGTQGNPEAKCRKFPRSMSEEGGGPDKSFGCGYNRDSPTFTTSLVQPQFLFTSTENATIQTFDVRLLFGDTSEGVVSTSGHPVQFSLIASP